VAGCRGKDISFDCENQHARLLEAAQQEEQPLVDVPDTGPYPVALQISAGGLNKLLASVIDEDVPFSGQVPFGLLSTGPASASFAPVGGQVPTISFREVPNCKRCVVFHLDFNVQLTDDQTSMPVSSGVGFVDLYIPLRLDSDASTGTSTLVAEYGKARMGDWYVSVFGFDSETHTVLAGALKILMTEQIAENNGDVALLELGSWQIGTGDVRLLARELFVEPDPDPTDTVEGGKIVLAMHTNLPLGGNIGLDLSQPLGETVVMQVSMDPDLLLTMAHRMLAEGEIARFYNEDGEADPDGIYAVSLDAIEASQMLTDRLNTIFRVWRVADGYCGFVEANMPLVLGTDAAFQRLTVTPGDAVIVAGEGSGAKAKEEEKLVEENQDLIDTFRSDLAAQIASTINYEALALEGSDIVFTNQGVEVTPAELTSYLDFLVLAQE